MKENYDIDMELDVDRLSDYDYKSIERVFTNRIPFDIAQLQPQFWTLKLQANFEFGNITKLPKNYQEFIEKYLPRYHSRGIVLEIDLLQRYLDKELCEDENSEDLKYIIDKYPNKNSREKEIQMQIDRTDNKPFNEALQAYFENKEYLNYL